MTRIYEICGIKTQCDFRFPTMTARAEKYLSAGVPALRVPFQPEKMERLKRLEPSLDDDNCEIICTTESFYMQLLGFGGFMLHSSAVVMDDGAYLFSAPSGTGKSTHTALWLELFGERAAILNDDKPAILLREGGVFACGTPWSGKSDLNLNMCVPLRGICVLERSPENFIEPLPPEKSVYALMNQTLRPEEPENMAALLDYIDRVTENVPIWRMGCNISTEAARLAYEVMSGGR